MTRWIPIALTLLAFAAPLPAQTPAPPGVPLLVAQVEDRTVAIELESLEARVRIHGFLAETTLEMTFFNRDPRVLEGDFLLSLPEGAVVCGYGLDVDGVLVDGVVVEKDKARIVFEREARLEIDPGLIEWAGGNLFRTRVYPIEGESRRTIRVRYSQQLDFRRRLAVYRLPLRGLPELRAARVGVEVVEPDRRPQILGHPFARLEETLDGGKFSARASEDDLLPGEDLEIVLTAAGRTMVLAEDVGGEVAFAVADFYPPRGSTARLSPRRLALFWDASFSRRGVDSGEALRALDLLLRQWRPTAVALTVFRDRAEAPVSFEVRRGRCPELFAALAEVVYDGATEWQRLELPPGFDADAAVLFGDGRITLGSRRLPELGVPTYVFGSGDLRDGALLRHLAESTGGAYFDLSATTPERLLRELRWAAVTLREVEAEVTVAGGEVRELEAPIGRPVDGATVVTGLLVGEAARLTLVYGDGGDDEWRRSVALRARPAGSGQVSRLRAQQKLGRLALYPRENHRQLLALGREHGLVTPATSLLVLERVDQYVDYEIEPPASLAEMRREYHEEMEWMREEARDVAGEHLEALREQWGELLAWSQGELDHAPTHTPQELQPAARSQTPAGTQSRAAAAPRSDPLAGRPAVARTLRGVVTFDDDGGPMPGVTVRLESEALLAPLTLISDAHGVYQTPVLTPGDYEISFSLEGFPTVVRQVRVGRGEGFRVDAALGSAFAEEMIVVTGQAPPQNGETVQGVILQPWAPELPYLDALAAVPDDRLYGAYLEQRRAYGSSPAFFVDCSRLFLDRGLRREGLRIASNLLELGIEDPRLIWSAANLFLRARAWGRAVVLFETLARLLPELPQPNRDLAQALILRGEARRDADPAAARRDFQRAASLLHQVAFEPWGPVASPLQIVYSDDGRFEEIGRIALVEYNWALHKLESLPPAGGGDVPRVDASWIQPLTADLRIVLTWEDDFADMDLWIIEPSGERVYYGHPRSAAGGLLSEDCTSGLGPESYLVREAMPGTYRIFVDYFGGSGPELLGPVTVQTLIVTGFGTDAEQVELQSVRLDPSDDEIEIGTVIIGD